MKLLSLLLTLSLFAPMAIAQTDEVSVESDTQAEATTTERFRPLDLNLRQNAQLEARTELQLERQDARQAEQDIRATERTEVQIERKDNRDENLNNRQETRSERQAEIRANFQARREAFQTAQVERREEIQTRMAERLANSSERREELRARFSTQAQTRITSNVANLNNRYQTTLGQAQSIYTRLESRVLTLQADGADVTEALDYLSEAQSKLELAADNVITAQVTAEVILDAEDATGIWDEARQEYQDAKDELQEIKALLQQALQAAKEASVELNAESRTNTQIN